MLHMSVAIRKVELEVRPFKKGTTPTNFTKLVLCIDFSVLLYSHFDKACKRRKSHEAIIMARRSYWRMQVEQVKIEEVAQSRV